MLKWFKNFRERRQKIKQNTIDSFGWYADFGDKRVYDKDVAKHLNKHLRLIDRFNTEKFVFATMWSFDILNGSVEEPFSDNPNWKYFRDF